MPVVTTKKKPCSSPVASPVAVLRAKRRRRTLTEQSSPHSEITLPPREQELEQIRPRDYTFTARQVTIESFTLQTKERSALSAMNESIFTGTLLKQHETTKEGRTLPALISLINSLHLGPSEFEKSNIVYVEILSARADSKTTLGSVLAKLYKTFIIEHKQKWLLVVGDAKTFDILQSMRKEYGHHLQWMLPFPGDWHILFNYQKALVKIYADAGLKHLAEATGHRAETLTSLIKCSNFKRTHSFLYQAFQAFYQFFIGLYKESSDIPNKALVNSLLDHIIELFQEVKTDNDLNAFRVKSADILEQSSATCTFKDFSTFIEQLGCKQDTVRFWHQFVFQDCLAYIALYRAIRTRNWQLRVATLKVMAAMFEGTDRPVYQRLTPQHLLDLAKLPSEVLHDLEDGCFSVRLSANEWHAVALDECYEMCINAKMAVVRPTPENMLYMSHYLQFRADCINNLKLQLFPEQNEQKERFSFKPTAIDLTTDTNIAFMRASIEKDQMYAYQSSNQGLWNILDKIKATPEQERDMLSFRSTGQEAYETYVKAKLLKEASTIVPIRKKRLCTFSATQSEKKRIKQLHKEQKLSQCLLKRHVSWLAANGNEAINPDILFGPLSTVPQALSDGNGMPYKSAKSQTTGYLEKRYSNMPVVLSSLSSEWVPDSVILEGMFLIQTHPLPTMRNLQDYVEMLIQKYLLIHLKAGVTQVHVVFDSPGSLKETPKEIEHARRDGKTEDKHHQCINFSSTCLIPSNWRGILGCRKCKKNLIRYVATELLHSCPKHLKPNQTCTANIGEAAYFVNSIGVTLPQPNLRTNADEGDLRVWLHCIHSAGNRKLILSRDTDVYHIGLTQAKLITDSEIIIQLSKSSLDDAKFIYLNKLVDAINSDPDISLIATAQRPQALQTLYIATGSDYTSFFQGLGKVSFLKTFFRHSRFILGTESLPGSLGDMSNGQEFFSFLRLVGSAYYDRHISAFPHRTPQALFNSITSDSPLDHHNKWLQAIGQCIWPRVASENHTLPSTAALGLHWRRCQWVVNMWNKCTCNDLDLPGKLLTKI